MEVYHHDRRRITVNSRIVGRTAQHLLICNAQTARKSQCRPWTTIKIISTTAAHRLTILYQLIIDRPQTWCGPSAPAFGKKCRFRGCLGTKIAISPCSDDETFRKQLRGGVQKVDVMPIVSGKRSLYLAVPNSNNRRFQRTRRSNKDIITDTQVHVTAAATK